MEEIGGRGWIGRGIGGGRCGTGRHGGGVVCDSHMLCRLAPCILCSVCVVGRTQQIRSAHPRDSLRLRREDRVVPAASRRMWTVRGRCEGGVVGGGGGLRGCSNLGRSMWAMINDEQ